MLVQEMTVTPVIAEQWLQQNSHNRPLRHHAIKLYADDIAAGRWQGNGETIKRSVTGQLLDGQHRLLAVVRSGTPVKMIVVSGLPDDAFKTIDTGMRRSASQLLALDGRTNTAIQAAIGRWLVILEARSDGGLAKPAVSSQQIFDALDQHPLVPHYASRHCVKGSTQKFMPSACCAALVLAAEKYGRGVVDTFHGMLSRGEGLRKGDPAFELRERLIESVGRATRLKDDVAVALTIKAVRAFAAQRQIGLLRWSAREEWPEV